MKLKTIVLFLLLVIINTAICKATTSIDTLKPEVGKPMPDFALTNVHHYKSSKVSLNEFKGKWLFLDFWFTGCSMCIKSFPKINTLQEEFKEQVQFMLIGVNEEKRFTGKGIETFFEKLRKKQNLNLAIAYDSVLNFRWDIAAMPYIIIIDPDGVVRYTTNGTGLTAEKVNDIINKKPVSFQLSNVYDNLQLFNPDTISNKEMIIYRSILTKWNRERQHIPSVHFFVAQGGRPGINISRVTLSDLYNIAYTGKAQLGRLDSLYGKLYSHPLLELENQTPFDFDFSSGKGVYNYDLIIPASRNNEHEIMSIMQRELLNTFGYSVALENRAMPVWKLIAKPGAGDKLKTRSSTGPEGVGFADAAGLAIKNINLSDFLSRVTFYIDDNVMPVMDETAINYNIDITMNVLMTDRDQVTAGLQKNGLDLVKGEKIMKVLVIRDCPNSD